MLVLLRYGRKQKFTNQNTELGTLCNGFAELQSCVLFQLTFKAAIMVKVTFETKSNI